MKKCKALMIQGTASNVGKSIVTTAFCRIFADMGIKVAPFKAQNMALNSFVTTKGFEIGRAQAVQAEAAGIEPTVEMNPILLKPTTDSGSQVIVMGRPVGNYTARKYYAMKERSLGIIREAYNTLCERFDLLVIEGAGSPAEINLMEQDIVNMRTAEMADAPVILVSDIDRGGVFASLLGTLELLPDPQRERVKGLLINKFRGDVTLFQSGIGEIERRSNKPVVGVLPWVSDLRIEEEDSVALTRKRSRTNGNGTVRIGVIRLPHISNYTDFDPLEVETDVEVLYIDVPDALEEVDAVILPGSKDTLGDLRFLHESGLASAIRSFAASDREVAGICGGFQMLGERVEDPYGVESCRRQETGLSILPIRTVLATEKVTARVKAVSEDNGDTLDGYEIHMGQSLPAEGCRHLFRITERNGRQVNDLDGACNQRGNVWGTYLHGIFENGSFRRAFLDRIRRVTRQGEGAEGMNYAEQKRLAFDRLADLFRKHIDLEAVFAMMELRDHISFPRQRRREGV
jgi:adenosylcobyric acid synthase